MVLHEPTTISTWNELEKNVSKEDGIILYFARFSFLCKTREKEKAIATWSRKSKPNGSIDPPETRPICESMLWKWVSSKTTHPWFFNGHEPDKKQRKVVNAIEVRSNKN